MNPLLCQLYWLPVDQLLYFRDAVMTYKCLHNLTLCTSAASLEIGLQFITIGLANMILCRYPYLNLQLNNGHLPKGLLMYGTILDSDLTDGSPLKMFRLQLKNVLLGSEDI